MTHVLRWVLRRRYVIAAVGSVAVVTAAVLTTALSARQWRAETTIVVGTDAGPLSPGHGDVAARLADLVVSNQLSQAIVSTLRLDLSSQELGRRISVAVPEPGLLRVRVRDSSRLRAQQIAQEVGFVFPQLLEHRFSQLQAKIWDPAHELARSPRRWGRNLGIAAGLSGLLWLSVLSPGFAGGRGRLRETLGTAPTSFEVVPAPEGSVSRPPEVAPKPARAEELTVLAAPGVDGQRPSEEPELQESPIEPVSLPQPTAPESAEPAPVPAAATQEAEAEPGFHELAPPVEEPEAPSSPAPEAATASVQQAEVIPLEEEPEAAAPPFEEPEIAPSVLEPAPFVAPQPESEPGEWTLDQLEGLVQEHAPAFADRVEEWTFYLESMRDFADTGGRLPVTFDWLIWDTFGELLERGAAEAPSVPS